MTQPYFKLGYKKLIDHYNGHTKYKKIKFYQKHFIKISD